MIQRKIKQLIKNDFFEGDIIMLMGARQVGKTTLYETLSGVLSRNGIDRGVTR